MWIAAYVATIWLANWAITTFGLVPVAPGLMAPAGVFFAGLALSLRDAVQDHHGRGWVVAGILGGAALSAWLSGPLALASGVAFLLSELADFAVYTPIRRRGWAIAVLASNAVGLVVDSMLFLWLAFGSLGYLAGQVVGKAEATLVVVGIGALLARHPRRALAG
jgi:queuosine precursor transporter